MILQRPPGGVQAVCGDSEMKSVSNMHAVLFYPQSSFISCTLVGNDIVHHSDVVGVLPVGAAPTTSSFST